MSYSLTMSAARVLDLAAYTVEPSAAPLAPREGDVSRLFAKVLPQFWTGETGREIRARGKNCQLMALFLFSAPHANALGVYYLPLAHMTEIALKPPDRRRALKDVCDLGLCAYDAESEFVWVFEMARYQIGELTSKDHMVQYVNREYEQLPKNPFLPHFFDRYGSILHLQTKRLFSGPTEFLGNCSFLGADGQLAFSFPRPETKVEDDKKRLRNFPEGFSPSKEITEWAWREGIAGDLEREFEAFKDYHISKGSRFVVWDRALRTWLRNSKKWGTRRRDKADALREATTKALKRGL